MTKYFCLALAAVSVVISPRASGGQPVIPKPLPTHPGNIFVTGENVTVPLPPGGGANWLLLDYEGKTIHEGRGESGLAALGKLSAGYYELTVAGAGTSNHISLGVLKQLLAPTPEDSPVSIDVAMAWSYPPEKMESVANLCALAGMNRVRDRLWWEQMEPKRGEYSASNNYDLALDVQTKAGLKVLTVCHASPSWSTSDQSHFPPDLRDVHDFYKALAHRWSGRIEAIEPWNEADLAEFGGHTGSEMASLQKAAYLGLKSGNPHVIACENVFAIRRAATLSDFNNNEAWPYFDTFNLHHYEPLQNYPSLYADFRAVSAGKPMWVSECSVLIHWSGDEKLKELSDSDAHLQCERVTKTYVLGMYKSAAAIFYFMLPHYVEGPKQYGLLRPDLTPRPGYVAAATLGRLMAGAKPLGRIQIQDRSGQAYCFRAKPDGKASDVYVVWAETERDFKLPAKPRACYDLLGRPREITGDTIKVNLMPIFLICDKDSHPKLIPPPRPAKLLDGRADPIVLQALLPKSDIILNKSAYKMPHGQKKSVPLYVYNFGDKKTAGKLEVHPAENWKGQLTPGIEIAPGERKEIPLELEYSGEKYPAQADIRVTGDFGPGGQPVLSFRMAAE